MCVCVCVCVFIMHIRKKYQKPCFSGSLVYHREYLSSVPEGSYVNCYERNGEDGWFHW